MIRIVCVMDGRGLYDFMTDTMVCNWIGLDWIGFGVVYRRMGGWMKGCTVDISHLIISNTYNVN